MAATTLVSTLLMGLVLLVIVAVVLRLRNWRRESPGRRGSHRNWVNRVVQSPNAWGLGFVVVVVAITGGALIFVGGLSVAGVDQQAIGTGLIAAFGILIGILFFGGIYSAARARGVARSLAIAVGTGVLGLLFIGGIAVRLIMAG